MLELLPRQLIVLRTVPHTQRERALINLQQVGNVCSELILESLNGDIEDDRLTPGGHMVHAVVDILEG